jgi:hypothetical protein
MSQRLEARIRPVVNAGVGKLNFSPQSMQGSGGLLARIV